MIGVFDSGIGGVTVLKELLKIMPNENYLYYSDSKNNPYGDKSNEEIINLSDNVVEYLINQGCKIIVIACNTASAISKEYLRNKYSIPIIAIEPAYKLVVNNEKTLVMATKATINSEKFHKLFDTYDNHNTVLLPCPGLADLIEEGNENKINDYLENKLKDYKDVKNVVLGCTHYPLIKDEIKKVINNANFYDGSLGVAKHTKEILEKNNLIENREGKILFIDSSNNKNKEELFYKILRN
ncbi:MAG: glutamate racemase [Bacilli bacterium]|nr:glutamate racemase [Bacilli bacterium]